MKQLIYLCLFFLAPSLIQAHHGERLHEGRWYEILSYQEINLNQTSKGLKIRGLGRRKAHFRYRTPVLLMDRQDRELLILSHDRILITEPSGKQRIFVDASYKVRNILENHSHVRSPKKRMNRTNVEGSWRFNTRDIVHIVKDRNGLKSRIKDQRDWVYYSTTSDKEVFVDRKGNTIEIKGHNLMIWRSPRNSRIIELKKFSDDLR